MKRTVPVACTGVVVLLAAVACGGPVEKAPPVASATAAPAPVTETPAPPTVPAVVEKPVPTAAPAVPAESAGPALRLRSQGAALGDADVVRALGKLGLRLPESPSSTTLRSAWSAFKAHEIETKTLAEVSVVVDHTTGLMWQATGSYKYSSSGLVKAADVKGYVSGLNAQKHAGFSNWRVPTLEELASVVDKDKHEGSWSLYRGFDLGAPWYALTTDAVKGDDSSVWTIDLGAGDLQKYSSTDEYYVLLVRTLK